MNVASLFEANACATSSALALRWPDGSLTYGELALRARRMETLLRERGVKSGDRVALLLPNEASFAVALLGILRGGAVAATLSPAWTPAHAARALEAADARVLVTTSVSAAAIGADPSITFVIDDGSGMAGVGAALSSAVPVARPPQRCGTATPATILFSSGTTGDPRGVVLTHGNLAFNARSKVRYCGITPTDRLAMVVPMAHCFGQNVVLLGALLGGASVRLFPRFHAGQVRDAIDRDEVSMLLASPTAFERLLALDDVAPLRRLRYALSAAAPMESTLAARWRAATGVPLAQGYGLTECSPFATYAGDAAAGSVGRAIDGVDVRIMRPDDSLAEVGEPGEIVVRGPNVMAGYWGRRECTARALRGGWLHTGDVGHLDAFGNVRLIDRLDDVINVAGFKAWPSDVERVLDGHPDVRESAAYAVADPLRGSAVAAAVALHPHAIATTSDLMRFIAPHLAGFQRPVRLRVVEALPRGPSGKLLRRVLAADDQRDSHARPANTERPATGFPAPSR